VNSFASAELPIPGELLKRRFPQVELGDCSLQLEASQLSGSEATRTLQAGGITLRTGARALLSVEGADLGGNAWRIALRNQPGGCTAWHADLDHNGREDLIITTFNPTSDGKDVTLTIIMIDDRGRPVPWQAPGYFDVDDHGVRDLLDLDQDGRAELAYLHLEGGRFEGQRSSLSLYKAGKAHWQRMSGRLAGLLFPILRPAGAKLTEDPDLSNAIDPRKISLGITSLAPGIKGNCGLQLPLDPESNNPRADVSASEAIGQTCYDTMVLSNGRESRLPEMIVVDSAHGRDVALGDTGRLIGEAKERRLSVQIVGSFCESDCRPFLLWASEGKQ
jgi:hypothetical protein